MRMGLWILIGVSVALLVAGCGASKHEDVSQQSFTVGGMTVNASETVAAASTLPAGAASHLKTFESPSGAMEPTLGIGSTVVVDAQPTALEVGQIVVFHPPHGADLGESQCGNNDQGFNSEGSADAQPCDEPLSSESTTTFIKRVVGLPGDTLRIHDGKVYRDGALVSMDAGGWPSRRRFAG